jgi:hypothetical protein
MLRPWTRSKKLRRACGGNPRKDCTRHIGRGLVSRRDAGGPKEQAHLSLGQERFTPPCRPRSTDQSTYLFGGVCPERGAGAPSCCRLATAKPCQLHLDEIATKVALGAHAIIPIAGVG